MKFKYLQTSTTRHGKLVYYVRMPGKPKVRLLSDFGTLQFAAEHQRAINGTTKAAPKADNDDPRPRGKARPRAEPQSLRWACQRYFDSEVFKVKKKRPRQQGRGYLESACEIVDIETRKPLGDFPYVDLRRRHVDAIYALYRDTPAASGQRVEALRVLFNWLRRNYEETPVNNPAEGWKRIVSGEGFYFWTDEDRRRFCDHWKIGTQARLWFALSFYLGVRISDVIRVGPQFEKSNRTVLHFVEAKGKDGDTPKVRKIPIVPELREIIDATTPVGLKTYMIGTKGGSIGTDRMSGLVRQWCDEVKLPLCTAHGVRKLGATTLAKKGASERTIRAYGGWTGARAVERYVSKAVDEQLNVDAVELLRGIK